MTHNEPIPEDTGRPEFDPRRSAAIRRLLVRTVASAPKPRRARLSRTAFALAATAALLFAGGIGAGSVVAYDRLSESVAAEDAGAEITGADQTAPTAQSLSTASGFEPRSDSAPATSDLESGADPGGVLPNGLTPVLTVNGETGYVYWSDLEAARSEFQGTAADSANAETLFTAGGGVPIYRADGATVLGSLDPAGLIP